MSKNLLPIVVAVLTVGVIAALTIYRNTCNVVDPESFEVSPCLTSGEYGTGMIVALVVGGALFFLLRKRNSA